MSEQATEKEKVTMLKLDIRQFEHLMVAFGNVVRELNSIAFKVKELETGLKLIEGELRLLRIEIMDKKGKLDEKVKK
jgi:hypothetical protein